VEKQSRKRNYCFTARDPWRNIAVHIRGQNKMSDHPGQRPNRDRGPDIVSKHSFLLPKADVSCHRFVQRPNSRLPELASHSVIFQSGEKHQAKEIRLPPERFHQLV